MEKVALNVGISQRISRVRLTRVPPINHSAFVKTQDNGPSSSLIQLINQN